ncbi:hypothetical protein OVY01_20990 [Robbsia sp. Bb-Pol-6]|uniref:Uncharacterized protein n=1 Tax=Robbsia betulipollinis TaxID=2981849 RepID=A0ABT3ZTS1_9BURK|nr:hypothetical protein [Robbsia betulipollinis]MCY0389627.1 hypothetical protein [Robbsia betulipollinis]
MRSSINTDRDGTSSMRRAFMAVLAVSLTQGGWGAAAGSKWNTLPRHSTLKTGN